MFPFFVLIDFYLFLKFFQIQTYVRLFLMNTLTSPPASPCGGPYDDVDGAIGSTFEGGDNPGDPQCSDYINEMRSHIPCAWSQKCHRQMRSLEHGMQLSVDTYCFAADVHRLRGRPDAAAGAAAEGHPDVPPEVPD